MHLKRLEAEFGCLLFKKAKSHNGICSRKVMQVKDLCQLIAHEVAATACHGFAEIPLMFVNSCEAVT
jgi:hypothetical protein